MYILLHTYTYAITVYVLLRCIAFFQRVYILCVYITHVMLYDFVRLDITNLGLVKLDIAYIL